MPQTCTGHTFFIVPCAGTLICFVCDTYVMRNGLPLARMPGALSLAYGGGLWERGGGCRFTATPVVQPTCDQYGAMVLDAPVGGDIQGQRRCRFPTTQRRLIQASPCYGSQCTRQIWRRQGILSF
jgi:hypothetical protein